MHKQTGAYHTKLFFVSGVKKLWLIQNNNWVTINKLIKPNRAFSISTFDFPTMYTNKPYNKFKDAMREVIKFCFKDRWGKYIANTKYGAIWVNNNNKHKISFDKKS